MKIQEILKERFVGRKFEFNECIYELDKYLDLVDKNDKYVEDSENLIDIINGNFRLVEEDYQIIDNKEAIKMLLDGELVDFGMLNSWTRYKVEGNELKYLAADNKYYKSNMDLMTFLQSQARIKENKNE